MFDIGWPELLVVAIVLIVVVGPKDLPPMLRAFGRTTKKLRSMASEFGASSTRRCAKRSSTTSRRRSTTRASSIQCRAFAMP
jgi:Tat protein translocase TatB subunit